jgi:hypothetical protein
MAPLVRTTTSITVLRAGAKINSIPGEATAFVVRLLSHLYLYGYCRICISMGPSISLRSCASGWACSYLYLYV